MQFLHAVGVAEAGYRRSLLAKEKLPVTYHADEIIYAGSGEGGTSEGEFWESINTACNLRLPVLYVIQDNEYAISVPVEVQTAGGSISSLLRGFPNLYVEECDGTDVEESYEAVSRAATHCRGRHGPALLHAHVIRPYSHSMSDDEALYRPPEELEDEARRDPIRKLEARLIASGHVKSDEVKRIHAEVDAEIDHAAEQALAVPHASGETAMNYVYSPDVDPTSQHFDTEFDSLASGEEGTMAELINQCLADEMEHDSNIIVLGQDVADASRNSCLDQVKGKGGVFKVIAGLQRKFGDTRVFNTPPGRSEHHRSVSRHGVTRI